MLLILGFLSHTRSFGHIKTDEVKPDPGAVEKDENSTVSVNQVQSTVVSQPPSSCIEEETQSDEAQTADGHVKGNSRTTNHVPLSDIVKNPSLKPIVLQSLSDADYLDSTGMVFKNRRLLLNCNNNLHIIDGEHYRYYIGIIDFFTRFQLRQKAGKVLKDLKTCCGSHSTERPEFYGQRFYEFIEERTS